MSLYRNINKRKKAGTSRSKKKSTISKEAYANMKAGFPKKKKKKHVQITHDRIDMLADKLIHGDKISNADVRRSLKNYEQKTD